ncbi:MAG: 16S rRNA (uracil(1498)-N(3))-methyltransferase [bacterium]|nr:16S rRNA (uracil(1498)-N(3))-methyltransferase [bacterium]
MPRFFKHDFAKDLTIEGSDAQHIIRSLRMKPGENLVVNDTQGTDYFCEIETVHPDRVGLKVLKSVKNDTEPSIKVTLFQCLPKGDKMDLIVRQAVEMGVFEIVPVLSERCVSRPDQKSLAKKVQRWQKIANEAAGQSGRGVRPQIYNLISINECIDKLATFDSTLFFYENGQTPINSLNLSHCKKVAVIIGCEGGFSIAEAEAFVAAAASAVTLGKRILRCETAPVAAMAALMLSTGNMD